uniref:Uncharacterized protein n=1 Tax=Arundo donax TaxID=35708 RepID=A0A0A8Z8L0_ARUDO
MIDQGNLNVNNEQVYKNSVAIASQKPVTAQPFEDR